MVAAINAVAISAGETPREPIPMCVTLPLVCWGFGFAAYIGWSGSQEARTRVNPSRSSALSLVLLILPSWRALLNL